MTYRRPTLDDLRAWLAVRGPIRGAAAVQGSNQSPTITQKYLNTVGYAGDPTPGAVVSTSQVSGSIVQPYAGMNGGILTISEGGAAALSDPASQTLFAGDYQYVQFSATSVNTAVQGQVVFWLTVTGQIWAVTPDFAPGVYGAGLVAGIALCNTGKGNYWFIQVRGIAQVKFTATTVNSSPSVGDLIYVDYTTPSALANAPATSTQPTNAELKLLLGRAWATNPAGGKISPVALSILGNYVPGA